MREVRHLTDEQLVVLRGFFSTEASGPFVLTGGTALSSLYLHHRISDDLDFVVRDANAEKSREAVETAWAAIETLADNEGAAAQLEKSQGTPWPRVIIRPVDPEVSLKIDLMADVAITLGTPETVDGIRFDSLEDIAAGKMAALMHRTTLPGRGVLGAQQAKDFVDLYYLTTLHGYGIQDLIRLNGLKDATVYDDLHIAALLRRVGAITLLPRMIRPLTVDELQRHIESLADELTRPYL